MEKKLILKLNEEKEGLRLVQIEGGLVVVDTNKHPKDIGTKHVYCPTEGIHYDGSYCGRCKEIIFADPQLGLEGVPSIEIGRNEVAIETFKKVHKQEPDKNILIHRVSMDVIIEAQQDLFTEEQVREAIKKAIRNHRKTDEFNLVRNITTLKEKIIQSLKQPSVEITLEQVNNKVGSSYGTETIYKPVKCVKI